MLLKYNEIECCWLATDLDICCENGLNVSGIGGMSNDVELRVKKEELRIEY